MKNLLYLGATILLACCNTPKETAQEKQAEVPLYVQMADSEMKRTPDPRLLDFREKPKWEYTNGLVCLSFFKVWKRTGDDRFLDYGKSYMDSMITDEGKILTYKLSDYNIDRINPGRFLIELNQITPKPEYKMAIETLREQMRNHPRTAEGGFWHKKRYPSQMWLDGLYMGSPFLAQYAQLYDEPALFDDVANQFRLIDKYAYSNETGLYYHGWDESREQKWADPETGLSPEFWGRAMGWFSMAVVDVLDYFPEDHPQRDSLIVIVNKIARGIQKHQDPASGVWWQVLDKGGKAGNYLEASCSSMFTYFLAKSIQKGYLDSSYQAMTKKAYAGLLREFIKENEDGTISLTNVCGVAGLGGDPYREGTYEYYVGEIKRDNDPKGVGPFIMASLWMQSL
ncbi:MAG: glycoside hydrolase family 88 protein [Marinoscillum sp.]|uniref:glycoside hydrolase family 88/105 protein n=1 Tax=Marinoscillum sp. TaxID=2024838 RepID=UPI003304FF19